MGQIRKAQAGGYIAPVDIEGIDPEMKQTLGITSRGPSGLISTVGERAGVRPFPISGGDLGPIQREIERVKAVNRGTRILRRRMNRSGSSRSPSTTGDA